MFIHCLSVVLFVKKTTNCFQMLKERERDRQKEKWPLYSSVEGVAVIMLDGDLNPENRKIFFL